MSAQFVADTHTHTHADRLGSLPEPQEAGDDPPGDCNASLEQIPEH